MLLFMSGYSSSSCREIVRISVRAVSRRDASFSRPTTHRKWVSRGYWARSSVSRGIQKSEPAATSNSGGITPTTWYSSPSRATVAPIAPVSPPNASSQKACPSRTVRVSPVIRVRPRIGSTPSRSKNSALTSPPDFLST